MAEAPSSISASELAISFDELRVRLAGLSDGYAQLFEISYFLETTLSRAHPTSTTPYLLELHDDLNAATAFKSAPEANPARLERVLRELERWQPLVPEPARIGYNVVITRLQQEVMITAALMGDFGPSASYLGIDQNDLEAVEDANANARLLANKVSVSRPGWRDAVLRRIGAHTPPIKQGVEARFPAVYSWSDRDARSHSAIRGHLCGMSFQISGKSKGEDELHMLGTMLSSSEERDYLKDVVVAGRRMLQELAPDTLAFGYTGNFKASTQQARLEGGSMRALMAVLYVLEVIRFNDRRTSFAIDASTVVSGDIDSSGYLYPLDSSSVTTKVEAAFFSRADRMILPREHLEEARAVGNRLREAYPKRRLSIHGVESIFDIFADRRFIDRRTKSRSRYTVEQTWKNRSKIISTAAVLLLFATTFLLYPTNIDPQIVRADLDNGHLNFVNKDNEVVHSFVVGERMHGSMLAKGARLTAIGDVNGDGLNDAFWGIQIDYEANRKGEITGIDGATGDTLMHLNPNFALRYPNDVSILSNDMVPGDMTLLDTNGDGSLELLVAFEHAEYYPSILAAINPITKDVLQRYDHPGALREMTVADLNGDGRDEILLSGINNSMREPVFLALDPADFSDTGPVTRTSYKPFPERIGKELAYYVLPESPLTGYNKLGARIADWINVLPNGHVTVSVWDAYRNVEGIPVTTAYRVTFDQQLRPVSIGTNDDWDAVWEEAASKGIVPADFSNDMKLEMLANVRRIK